MFANAKQFVPLTSRTHGPQINVQKNNNNINTGTVEERRKNKVGNKSIMGKFYEKRLWLAVKLIAGVDSRWNYRGPAKVKRVQRLRCSFVALSVDKGMHKNGYNCNKGGSNIIRQSISA